MAMNIRRNPLAALLDYAANRGDEASSIGSVMSQLASPILKSQGVQPESAVQRGPVPQPTLANVDTTTIKDPLFGRMVRQESGGQNGLVSPKGAAGLSQVLPSTAMDPGYSVPTIFEMADAAGIPYADKSEASAKNLLLTNDALNLQFGQAYKDAMAGRYNGDPAKTAAAYNAGPGAVDAYGGVPPYPETQGYVANVVPGYNTSVSTMSAPQAGGGMPQTVEGILSTLYPDGSADEKKAHRKDILMGLSQGFSALSQGRPVDLSNIAANADQRRRQYVLDTREKEKAKAAASLVYSQTGDANMAAGIASGAINYSDVLNERQMKRAEQAAQDARLKDAATTDALVTAMKAGKLPQETIDLVQKGGVDALSAYQKIQADQSLLEHEAKQEDIKTQNVADARYILSTATPGSVQARAAERVIALGGEEDVYTLMKDRAPAADAQFTLGAGEVRYGPNGEVIATGPASAASDSSFTLGAGEVRYGPNGEVIATGPASAASDSSFTLGAGEVRYGPNGEVIAKGPASADAASGFTLGAGQARYDAQGNVVATGPAAPPGMQYALGPNGEVVLVPAGAPAAAGGAPSPTVGNAFGNTFGSVSDAAKAAMLPGDLNQQALTAAATEAGTAATRQATAQDIVEAPLDFALLQADLDAKRQANEQALKLNPDARTKSALEVEAADLANQQAVLDARRTQAETVATRQKTAIEAQAAPVELQNAQADLAAQLLENRKNAATETDEVAKAALDADAARIANEKAILDLQIAKASQEPDLELKRLAIEKATADLAASQQAATDTKKTAEDKAAQRQIQATVSADTVMRYGKDILDMTSDWSDSVLAGGVNIVAGMIPRSEVSEVADRVDTIKNLTALDSLTAMRNSSPTGAAVGNVSDTEGKRLEARYGALNVKGDPVKLREDIQAAMNAYLDTVYGTPEQIRQRYEDGKITGAIADAYSARYSTRGAGVDPAAANVGGITTLGLTDTDMTVLGSISGADSLLAPDTLTPEERAILDSLTAPAGGK